MLVISSGSSSGLGVVGGCGCRFGWGRGRTGCRSSTNARDRCEPRRTLRNHGTLDLEPRGTDRRTLRNCEPRGTLGNPVEPFSIIRACCALSPRWSCRRQRSCRFPFRSRARTGVPARPLPPAAPPTTAARAGAARTGGAATGDPNEATLGTPIYPLARFIASYDAGRGQRYYLFGTETDFLQIVTYYRTVLKQKGELVFEEPPVHMFDLGRFREETMAFPPSVTVKDYTWGGSLGYLNPKPGASRHASRPSFRSSRFRRRSRSSLPGRMLTFSAGSRCSSSRSCRGGRRGFRPDRPTGRAGVRRRPSDRRDGPAGD